MINSQDFVPIIQPLTEEAHRPFWSVMIPAYNCANYLVETLNSVLAQDPGAEEMQIEVVDDCSSKDDPEAVVKELGKGRVSYFRHPNNYGAIPTFNTCIQRAKGYWVHILHGDDLVVPGFYSRFRESLEKQPTVGAAFCRSILIDDHGQQRSLSSLQRPTPGILSDWIERIAVTQQIETPAIIVRRSVYEKLGGFHLELFHAADWEMWKRIAVYYPVWYEPQPLAYYRIHSASDTSRLIRTGANIANIRRAIEISELYLPSTIVGKISNQSRENYAFAALNIARQMLSRGDIDAAIAQVWEGLNCSNSSEVIESLISLITPINSEQFFARLSKYAEEKPGNITSQSALVTLNQALEQETIQTEQLFPKIIVDGVFFQLYKTGIARVWKSLLEEWVRNEFAKHIIVLDRADSAPKIPGIRYRSIPHYDYNNTDADREMLQQVCDEEGADLFISSYYTTPNTTPSVFMGYDMIPEVMGWDMDNPMWREKHQGIQNASAYIAISEHTAHDLARCFTDIPLESITVAHCGVSSTFVPSQPEDVNAFKLKYGITKPYFILVGVGSAYKNSILFFQAFSKLAISYGLDIVCTGSGGLLAPEFRAYTSGSVVYMLQLSDEELATAYSGAVALVYPSKYEGFGMPVIEAMACGCPVITCPNASIPEVAGDAAIYVNDNDVDELANALCEVQKPSIRNSLISAGLTQAKKFSWATMAQTVSSVLIDTTLLSLKLKEINLIIFPDWSQPEEIIGLEIEQVVKAIATHPNSENITLLISTRNIAAEDAELFLSSVAMNLLVQEDLDVTQGLEISLIANLADIQWEALLPRIHAKIVLEHEDKNAVKQAKAEAMTSYQIESFSQAQAEQFSLLKQ
jgi:glycosyltransferase involved in cell wall biosynthesis